MITWSEKELQTQKARIMRRVYFIWFLKKVIAPAIFIVPFVGFILFREISGYHVQIILNNTMERLSNFDLVGLSNYLVTALYYTEYDSLLMVGFAIFAGAFFARRLVRDVMLFWTRSFVLGGLAAREKS